MGHPSASTSRLKPSCSARWIASSWQFLQTDSSAPYQNSHGSPRCGTTWLATVAVRARPMTLQGWHQGTRCSCRVRRPAGPRQRADAYHLRHGFSRARRASASRRLVVVTGQTPALWRCGPDEATAIPRPGRCPDDGRAHRSGAVREGWPASGRRRSRRARQPRPCVCACSRAPHMEGARSREGVRALVGVEPDRPVWPPIAHGHLIRPKGRIDVYGETCR